MNEEDSEPEELESPHAARRKMRRFHLWLRLVLWGSIALLMAFIFYFSALILFRRTCVGYDHAKAIQNAKQVGYALSNFENDFGCYPNDETAKKLDEGAILSSAGGSNYYFSQLIAGGYVDQESTFFARTGHAVEPDNEKSTPDQILRAGEVGFAYVLWGAEINSGNLPADAPLVIAFYDSKKSKLFGLIESTEHYLIILRKDMSVTEFKADRNGKFILKDKDYFDWSQPHWGGQKPKIVWPE